MTENVEIHSQAKHVKTALYLVLKVIVLTIIMFICFSTAGSVIGLQSNAGASEQSGIMALLLFVCFLYTIVLTYIIHRSNWRGWHLMITIFFVFYGIMTFMSQIESAVFVTRMPPGTLPRLFLMGILIAAPFSVLAVMILGKRRVGTENAGHSSRLVMPAGEWVWKLSVIALVYVVLYFTFGYFIAWKNPAVLQYYGGVDEGSFFAHMKTVLTYTFWLIPFQFLRGLLWTVIALPVIRMMKGTWLETALAIGVLFAIVMTAPLLLPNPYMPEAVRYVHLSETSTSNFIFGFFIGWLLTRPEGFVQPKVVIST